MARASAHFTEARRYQCYCSLRSQQLGQNPFQITYGDRILPRMSRGKMLSPKVM